MLPMWISDLSIRRPVMAIMVIAGLMALGLISMSRIGIDLFPRVEFPYVTVETYLDGASPGTIETEITDKLEEEAITISGIEDLRSISSEGYSQLLVEFELEEDVNVKAQEVRDKVNSAIPELPEDVELPTISKMDPDAQPILSIMVSGPLPIRDLTAYAKDVVKERLQRITGVGGIQVVGGREREIRIWLDAPKLRGFEITVDDVINAIRREHAEIPGGRLDYRGGISEFTLKTKGEVLRVRDFENIVIARRGPGYVRVRDVARVEDGLEDERTYAELDGVAGVSLDIRRQSGTNTVKVSDAIMRELEKIRTEAPKGVRLVEAKDTSRFIKSSIRDVTIDILLGIVLVVIVTLCFLTSIRATIIAATAIPAAIISTFFVFYLLDFTINLVTMLAVSLTVGLLVDDAIVVLEAIHRKVEDGVEPKEAASKGTRNVATAVVAATLTVMAVFLPIAFMTGLIGRFFYQYGMTIAVAVAISLLVSLTLTPMLCSKLLRRTEDHGFLYRWFNAGYERLERGYVRLLEISLRTRWLVLLIAAASVYVGIQAAGQVPLAFTSKTDRSEFLATVELPLGTGISQTKRIGNRIARSISAVDDVKLVYLSIGSGAQPNTNEIEYYIGLTPKLERETTQRELIDEVRRTIIASAPDANNVAVSEISWVSGASFFAADIELSIQGPDLQQLNDYAESIMTEMKQSDRFRDIRSSFELGKPEAQVLIDRNRASDLGISIRSIASTVRAAIGGADITTFEEFGSRYDVRARMDEAYRDDITKLNLLQVRAADGTLVDFQNIAEVSLASGPAQIDRLNRARKISIYGNAPPGFATGELIEKMDEIIERMDMPPAYETAYQGASKQVGETLQSVLFAFGLALLTLYMILASQFDSFSQPAVIMTTAPLSFVGAFSLLAMTGYELSLFAQIGLVALMGLVMKNGILLVDYANRARERGSDPQEAMLEAGKLRLRPVLMTAFSTIFGMIPIAVASSDGAEFRNAMGVIVIGGLLSSTLLTLVVVPTVYTLFSEMKLVPDWARKKTVTGVVDHT